ncbi:MAG: TolC family protein [Dysgonamonadaceae bacterium]|jgi:outer membrane protein TolC|nr:TolC family protein [Dysgonamonadaceae bacterium]
MKAVLGKKISIACMAVLFSVTAKAQGAQPPIELTLEKAIEIALSENPSVKIAVWEIPKVDYAKKSAWYGLIPSLEATGQYSKYLTPQKMSLAGMLVESPTDFNATATLQLSLPLFVPALWRSIQMTEIDMQLAVEKAYASKITLRNDVTKAYYGVLLAQDSYKALQDGYSLAEEVYTQAKKRFDLGLSAEYDMVSAEVQMKNLQPNLLEVENGVERAKLYLKVLMGVNASVPLIIKGNLSDYEKDITPPTSQSGATPSLKETKGNTDLKQLDIQKQLLQKSLQLQQTQRMPTLAAFGQYSYAGTGNNAGASFMNPEVFLPATQSWFSQGLLVGLQLNIPLTGIFTNTFKEKQTAIQIRQIDIQRDYLEKNIDLQIRTAVDNMNKAAKQADAAKKNKQLAQKGYEIASKRYENGAGTVLELQNASLALTQSQLTYNQSIESYLSSKSDLDKILGVNPEL